MAHKVWNGSGWESVVQNNNTISSVAVSQQTYFIDGCPLTAPNTSNKITGAFFYINSNPSAGDLELEVRESGIVKVSGTLANADIKTGWNWLRFSTPYQFTTTSAGAYIPWVKNTSAASGQIQRDSSVGKMQILLTIDATPALGATDDLWVMGYHQSGFTPVTFTATDGLSFGSGTDTAFNASTRWTLGAALTTGNGGTFSWDTTANTTVTIFGSTQCTEGGVFDLTGNQSDITKVATLIMSSTVDGRYGISNNTNSGGRVNIRGKATTVAAQYASGLGTTGSPLETVANHNFAVDDELIIGGANTGTNDYQKNERKYVKSIPSSNQLILANSIGGAEAGLSYTHASGSHIGNMRRNAIVKPSDVTRGYFLQHVSSTTPKYCDFSYSRFEYSCCLSGKGLLVEYNNNTCLLDGIVSYNNSSNGRISISVQGSDTASTYNDIIMYNTRGTNYSGQSGIAFQSASNKTINRLYHFAEPSSTTNTAGLSLLNSATNNTINEYHSYGANAQNGSLGYSIGIFSSAGNIFNDCTIDAARIRAILTSTGQQTVFNDCRFGMISSNTADLYVSSNTINDALYNRCYFGSASLIDNYQASLEGSEYAYFEMDGNENKHRWYRKVGSGWSAGAGLTDTTVRTPGSLSLCLKPEDATKGMFWQTLIPANPSSQTNIFGYLYRNATFSTGDLIVELYLPGSDTPDATYTLPTTTGAWLPFNLSAYYSGTVSRYALFKVIVKTTTAGAYTFLDDLYDAGTGNKIAGLDTWYAGKPSPVLVATDTSSIPNQTTLLVESALEPYFEAIPTSSEIASAVDAILAGDFAALPTAVQSILNDDFAALPTSGQIATAVDAILADNFAAIPTNPLLDDDARLDALADISTLPSAEENAQAVWSDDTDYPEPQKGGLLDKTRKLAKQIRDNVI